MGKRLGIVCNYSATCGIASYAASIVRGFNASSGHEVSVHRIDTELLKLTTSRRKRLVREHFKQLSKDTRHCEVVNIQFENGLFGESPTEVLRNLTALMSHEAHYILTMHTADFSEGFEDAGGWLQVIQALASFNVARATRMVFRKFSHTFLTRLLRKISDRERVSIIVHTQREAKAFSRYIDQARVFVHPLVFLEARVAELARQTEDKEAFRARHSLAPDTKTLLINGFISPYKGHLTAIRALRYLPDNFTLLIAGSEHPKSIRRHEESSNYQRALLAEIQGYASELGEDPDTQIESAAGRVTWNRKKSLGDRVRFLGFVSDDEMIDLLRNADVSVFPYLETGQSSSGPASLALELGAPILASNALVFNELKKFAPNCFTQFDIGNFIELASKVEDIVKAQPPTSNTFNEKYSLEENIRFYSEVIARTDGA